MRGAAADVSYVTHDVRQISTSRAGVPGYEASNWYGVGAPKATPAEIIDQLNKEISAGLADPNLKAQFADLGDTVLAGSAADFGKLIADEGLLWVMKRRTRSEHIRSGPVPERWGNRPAACG
jgi:tripartite tricarboxylate transporter family receptor